MLLRTHVSLYFILVAFFFCWLGFLALWLALRGLDFGLGLDWIGSDCTHTDVVLII